MMIYNRLGSLTVAFILLFVLWGAPAFSQEQQYVPFTVDQKSYEELTKFLVKQPYEVAAPILQWLQQQEQAAIAAKKAELAKPVESKKP